MQYPCHNVRVVRTFEPADHRRPPALKPLPSLATAVQRPIQSGFHEVAITSTLNGYTVPRDLTEPSRFPDARESDSTWRTQEVRHVGSDSIAPRFWCVPAAWFGEEDERRPSGPSASGVGGVGLQIIRDWVLHFNERGPDGLLNGKSPGGPQHRMGPGQQHCTHSCRGRCQALQSSSSAPPFESPARLSRREGGAGHSISFPARLDAIARENAVGIDTIEIWFADEARVGQKNKITRRWAKRGTRPIAPRDQRTASTYIFGAVCPKQDKGAALIILPTCNTEAMNLHLAEIAATVRTRRPRQ